MKNTLTIIAIAAVLAAGSSLTAATSPSDEGPTISFTPAAGATPPPVASEPAAAPLPLLPKVLEGVVTPQEYKEYVTYQIGLRDDPEFKAVETRIFAKLAELKALQAQLNELRDKALSANPVQQAIGDKIMKAMSAPPLRK